MQATSISLPREDSATQNLFTASSISEIDYDVPIFFYEAWILSCHEDSDWCYLESEFPGRVYTFCLPRCLPTPVYLLVLVSAIVKGGSKKDNFHEMISLPKEVWDAWVNGRQYLIFGEWKGIYWFKLCIFCCLIPKQRFHLRHQSAI